MFSIFRDADQMEAAEEQIVAMLASCQDTFDLATGMIIGIGTAGQLADSEWLIFAPSRIVEMLVHGPYGLARLLTASRTSWRRMSRMCMVLTLPVGGGMYPVASL